MKVAAIAAAAVFVFAACSEIPDVTVEAPVETVAPEPEPTAPPTTQAPTTTRAPSTTQAPTTTQAPLPVTPAVTRYDCVGLFDAGAVSVLIPNDWDAHCAGFLAFSRAFFESSPDEADGVCRFFWDTPDTELMNLAASQGLYGDAAIGAIDFMWTVC